MKIAYKCPYCGYEGLAPVEAKFYTTDVDDGGCDKDFVLDCILTVESSIRTINE